MIITRNPPHSPVAVAIDGTFIEADDKQKLFESLRKYKPKGSRVNGMTLQQIADIAGCSRQNVHQYLGNDVGNLEKVSGNIALVKTEAFVNFSNVQLSRIYHIPTSTLKERREELGIKHISDDMFMSRQTNLCRLMFGKSYSADINFKVFIVRLMEELNLTDKQKDLITRFYFTKETESFSNKTYRYAIARGKLQAYMRVKLNKTLLKKIIKLKYIKRNKREK